MKKTFFKTILTLLVILLLGCVSITYATDINMNLTANNYTEEYNNISTNTFAGFSNSIANMNYSSSNSIDFSDASTVVSNASSTQDSTLGLPQILNILLIVVGVVIILLAIAILIRLKS